MPFSSHAGPRRCPGRRLLSAAVAALVALPILALPLAQPAGAVHHGDPKVTLDPTCAGAPGGETITVHGSGFWPGGEVMLTVAEQTYGPYPTTEEGAFTAKFRPEMSDGTQVVTAADGEQVESHLASASFQVPCAVPAPEVTPSPQPTQLPPQVGTSRPTRISARDRALLLQIREKQEELDQVVAEWDGAQERVRELEAQIAELVGQLEALRAEVAQAERVLGRRAAAAYKQQRVGLLDTLLSSRTFWEFVARFQEMSDVVEADSDAVRRWRTLTQQAERASIRLEALRHEQTALRDGLAKRRNELEADMRTLYDRVRRSLRGPRSPFTFPVFAPYSYVDTFGAPRMEGTSFYHRHEGTDIFAPSGTPIIAVVDGIVERVGTDLLGGTKLWLRSPADGWTYYYAHLSGYAPGIAGGMPVQRGQVLGYVGNTGNAKRTPSHLHFEAHEPGGLAVNPYPILNVSDRLRFRR